MNAPIDPLESRLSRQPLRAAPSYLRRRILESAPGVDGSRGKAALAWHARIAWSWAALAAVWMVAMAGTRADRWLNGPASAGVSVPDEQRVLARLQREELFDATGGEWRGPGINRDTPDRQVPVIVPRPRSDRRLQPAMGSVGWVSESTGSV